MLTLSEISKSFGGRTLFSDVSLQVNRGDRIGLVGPNGAGKSTLFSLILQTDTPDDGQVNFERGITLGYLPQESAPAGDETVVELATAITPDFVEVSRKLKAWETTHPDDIDPHDNVHDRFNELDGYQVEARAKKILKGLSFRDSDFDRPARGCPAAGSCARTWRDCSRRSRTCSCSTSRRTTSTSRRCSGSRSISRATPAGC